MARFPRVNPCLLALALMVCAATVNAKETVLPARGAQGVLTVDFDKGGQLFANVCKKAPCPALQGQPVDMPREAQDHHEKASFQVVQLGYEHSAVIVTVPSGNDRRSWQAVIAASVSGYRPHIAFSGWTGFFEGQDGELSGAMVHLGEPSKTGVRRIVIGEQREDLTLCGRPAVLAPRVLHPKNLKLYPAIVQRLSQEERDRAPRLVAIRDEKPAGLQVLRAVAASSAIGTPQALADGDLESTWSEARGGAGRGEFVLLNAPSALPMRGATVVVRPPTTDIAEGAAPRSFWLATTHELFHITLPEDAWQHPGAAYRVEFATPVRSDCLAVVTEDSFSSSKDAKVTFAELGVIPDVATTDIADLVNDLRGGGPGARAARALLVAAGTPGFSAVEQAFRKLDEGGRREALFIVDQAPCAFATRTYTRALLGRFEAQRVHAKERLRRCGKESSPYLLKTLAKATPQAKRIVANELALIDPLAAVRGIAPLFKGESGSTRRGLRASFALAARQPGAQSGVDETLQQRELGGFARLEILRALGQNVRHYSAAQQAFDRLASNEPDFRIRYLLLSPAAQMAEVHAPAQKYVSQAITSDPSAHVRAAAARVALPAHLYQKELLAAAQDEQVRVRHAAAHSLAGAAFATSSLVNLLAADRWPMVRGAAAEALAKAPSGGQTDEALALALEDDSHVVRAPTITSIAERRVLSQLPKIRDLALDDEHNSVRLAAVTALGTLCDRESVDSLTKLAIKRADPMVDAASRSLATRALGALGRIGPDDLKSRLEPLLSKGAAPGARAAAERTLGSIKACP